MYKIHGERYSVTMMREENRETARGLTRVETMSQKPEISLGQEQGHSAQALLSFSSLDERAFRLAKVVIDPCEPSETLLIKTEQFKKILGGR